MLLFYSIPLHTPQIGWNRKLDKWVVLDGMDSIILHSIPFIIYKTKQWNLSISHYIPFHSTTFHQSKHSLSVYIMPQLLIFFKNVIFKRGEVTMWGSVLYKFWRYAWKLKFVLILSVLTIEIMTQSMLVQKIRKHFFSYLIPYESISRVVILLGIYY
jgi:hypothetical protein